MTSQLKDAQPTEVRPADHLQREVRLPQSHRGVLWAGTATAAAAFAGLLALQPRPHRLESLPAADDDTPLGATAQPTEPAPYPIALGPELPAPHGGEARLVLHRDKTYVILQSDASVTWGRGPIRPLASARDDLMRSAHRALKQEHLSDELAAWRGRRVHLYGQDELACTGIAGQPELVATIADDGITGDDMASFEGAYAIAAPIEVTEGDCTQAIWARDSELPAPALARLSPLKGARRRAALKTFRALPAHRKLQTEYSGDGLWDRPWGDDPSAIRLQGRDSTLVVVTAQVGGCGDFEAQLTAVFEEQEDGSLELRSAAPGLGSLAYPRAAADLNGDGQLELFVQGDGLDYAIVSNPGDLQVREEYSIPIFYCLC
jgi:hypothetical protein